MTRYKINSCNSIFSYEYYVHFMDLCFDATTTQKKNNYYNQPPTTATSNMKKKIVKEKKNTNYSILPRNETMKSYVQNIWSVGFEQKQARQVTFCVRCVRCDVHKYFRSLLSVNAVVIRSFWCLNLKSESTDSSMHNRSNC